MKRFFEFLSMIAVLVWGGVFLHFYLSGRVESLLDPSFRIYVLVSGVGFLVLGLFNLLTFRQNAGACCEHGHDHDHGHGHGPQEKSACCSGDTAEKAPSEKETADEHGTVAEGEDDHFHSHDHSHEHEHEHEHFHPEETASSLAFAIIVLLVPLVAATAFSKDSFSMGYLKKWDKIERDMQRMRLAEARNASPGQGSVQPSTPNPYTNPEGDTGDSTADVGNTQGGENADQATSADTPPETADASADDTGGEAWGEFTLEDLKQMVPQSEEGNFQLDVPQIFYTAGDRELMKVMEGIPVETVAQLMEGGEELDFPGSGPGGGVGNPGAGIPSGAGTSALPDASSGAPASQKPDGPDGTKRLLAFRLFIECCAADARPLSINVELPAKFGGDYEEMSWYEITGTLHYEDQGGEDLPLLRIKELTPTTEPVEGLLY